MEKYTCKLCHRKFANGRALGGHMRYHMMSLPIPPKQEPPPSDMTESLPESSSSSSSSDSDDDIELEDDDVGVMENGFREDPDKRSIKLADLEDRESETESTRNPTRRRSRRRRKPVAAAAKSPIGNKGLCDASDCNEADPVSSISEVASEEDLAFCLMMLSRDKWSTCHGRDCGDIANEVTDSYNKRCRNRYKNKYKCDTCHKVFRSYQALGGHRASHKKTQVTADHNDNNNNNSKYKGLEVSQNNQKKTHECPVCFRVFASGQALGGHKRSHVVGSIENDNDNPKSLDIAVQSCKKIKTEHTTTTTLIDLNLPAPVDDDDDGDEEMSQIAVSAVSDAHL